MQDTTSPNPQWIWSPDHQQYYYYFTNTFGQQQIQWQSPQVPAQNTGNERSSSSPRSIPPNFGLNAEATPTYSHPPVTEPHQSNYQATVDHPQQPSRHPIFHHQYQQSEPEHHPQPHQQHTTQQQADGRPPLPEFRHVQSSSSTYEEPLDPRYRRVSPRDQQSFFIKGRVFSVLWTEPVGTARAGASTNISYVQYRGEVYTEIRRFVVVKNHGLYSLCIPIHTYSGQGATKRGIRVEHHAIVYTGDSAPRPLLGEEEIDKYPLKVIPTGGHTLDLRSRINFGKTYTVEHNLKVLKVGKIAQEHLHLLESYWATALGANFRTLPPEVMSSLP